MTDRISKDVQPQSSDKSGGNNSGNLEVSVEVNSIIANDDDKMLIEDVASTSPPGADGAASKTSPAATEKDKKNDGHYGPSDEAVMAYLQKRGLSLAEKELKTFLRLEEQPAPPDGNKTRNGNPDHKGDSSIFESELMESALSEQFEKDEAFRAEEQREKSNEQRMFLTLSSGGGLGYDLDSASALPAWGSLNLAGVPLQDVDKEMRSSNVREVALYIESFTALQTWVLSLPDDPAVPNGTFSIAQQPNSTTTDIPTMDNSDRSENPILSLGKGVSEILRSAAFASNSASLLHVIPPLPPSAKPELMAVCFPLLVHSYCELLEYGMETDAEALLSAWKWLYLPIYSNELRDLDRCNSTIKIVALNHLIITHKEQLRERRSKQAQLEKLRSRFSMKDQQEPQLLVSWERKVQEAMQVESHSFRELQSYPFLYRVRTSRMQLSLSAYTYSLLTAFMARERLIPMAVLLMTKCHLSVESRDPLPYTPACVLVDAICDDNEVSNNVGSSKRQLLFPAVSAGANQEQVNWAAPNARFEHIEEISENQNKDIESAFPPFTEEANVTDAEANRSIEFNRSLLLNGFRRLEALQIKTEYEEQTRSFQGDKQMPTPPLQNLCDPLSPSVVLATCCTESLSGFHSRLETAAIEITCAKLCPGDGRKLAIGCDDAAIRIWCLDGSGTASTRKTAYGKETVDGSAPLSSGEVTEPHLVLVGHKDGWPVFGVDFCKDGRSLISCGGDGTVRLWDTAAVGPYGRLAKAVKKTAPKKPLSKGINSSKLSNAPCSGNSFEMKRRSGAEIGGAALSVYRGHSYNTPVWDCRFAPSGYYFATCGGDTSGKIWTTDRPTPVRSLVGHLSSVNCIAWHPNVNYVVTGSDDNTCRMWDVQTGRCVRVLTGFHGWVASLEVCPSGKYVAAVDGKGVIGIHDLSS